MSVIDQQRNHVGVQSLVTQFANYAAAGQGAMLQHTDGYIYCVFARNYLNGVYDERRLYLTRSNDAGLTWTAAIELTNGAWDDDPAILELAGNSIGLVYNHDDTLYRLVFDKDTGAITTSATDITGSPTNHKWISVVTTSTGYMICCLQRNSISGSAVFQYTNSTSFTANNWVADSKTVFPTNQQAMSLNVKRLAYGAGNGHLALVGAYRTDLNGRAGTESPGMSNLPAGMLRCDVGVSFSSNDGGTWTTVQKLTNYTGSPALDLVGITSVASAALEELSDGTIVVGYQEHTAPQYTSSEISPSGLQVPSTAGIVTSPRYRASDNTLFWGGEDATNGGVFIFDLTAQTRTRLYSGSVPYIWANDVVDLDISPDGTKLVVATISGGITILGNITDPDKANWTQVKDLHTTSTPALLSNKVTRVQWDGNDTIFFSYGEQTIYHNWGARYDISTDTLTALTSSVAFNLTVYNFVVQPTKVVLISNQNRIEAVDKSTGVSLYFHTTTDQNTMIFYDSVNSEYVCLSSSSMVRITDTGSTFAEQQRFTQTSNPAATGAGTTANYSVAEIPGHGLFIHTNTDNHYQWYSYASKQPAGYRVRDQYLGLGENVNHFTLNRGLAIKDDTWLVMPADTEIVIQNLVNVGRVRYAYFPYDAGTKQLLTPGVDFYDVCNINKVGTNMTTLQFPKLARDADDRLYWYFCRWDLLQPGGNEFAPVLGIVEPDVVKFTARARIKKRYVPDDPNALAPFVYARARLKKRYVTDDPNALAPAIQARMRIVFAQCIKAQARIVPRNERSFTAQARIKNWKSTTCRVSFSAQKTGATTRLRLNFWANTGYTRSSSLTARASIIQTYTCRTTGHFLVRVPASNTNLDFSVSGTYKQTLAARARIVSW